MACVAGRKPRSGFLSMRLVLASSSTYRGSLLQRLGLPFDSVSPDIDEAPHPGETPAALARRLAESKARAVAERYQRHLIIGSDQVANLHGESLGKPGSRTRNIEQLRRCAGQTVTFATGLCVLNSESDSIQLDVIDYAVQFLPLTQEQVARYVDREHPFDCAGGFKSEGLGVSLFREMSGTDPSALVGLPLIKLCEMLRNEGLDPLG